MKSITLLSTVLALTCSVHTFGDSIVIDGKRYENVYITESSTRYYVALPETGESISVSKNNIDPDHISLTKNAAQREGLLQSYKSERDDRPDLPIRIALPANLPTANENDSELKDSETIPHIRGDASYRPNPALQQRIQQNLAAARARGMMANAQRGKPTDLPSDSVLQQGLGGGGGGFGGAGGGGGFGGGGFGGTGGGGGFGTGAGGGGFGGAGGGGGFGGAGGGGGFAGAAFPNISQLFSTYDDTLVGEFPNLISQVTGGGAGGGFGGGRGGGGFGGAGGGGGFGPGGQ